MNFDLKYLREDILKISQAELADKLELRQDLISRMEKKPDQISLEHLMKISTVTGYSLTDLLNLKPEVSKEIKFKKNFSTLYELKDSLLSRIDEIYPSNNSIQIQSLSDIKKSISLLIHKPRIAFLGQSDTGKSTMLNTLLSQEVMPAGWTPTTAVPIIIRHKEDKPDHLKEDENLVIFSLVNNKVTYDEIAESISKNKNVLHKKDIEFLKDFSTRSKDFNGDSVCIIYLNSEILRAVDLIDLPGYGTGDREDDDLKAQMGKSWADFIVYLSISNGFLRGTDISYLLDIIHSHRITTEKSKSMNNIFIVASQSQLIDSDEEMHSVLDQASNRLLSVYNESTTSFEEFSINFDMIRSRMFTYSKDTLARRSLFESSLESGVVEYIETTSKNLDSLLTESLNKSLLETNRLIEELTQFLNQVDELSERREELELVKIHQIDVIRRQITSTRELMEDARKHSALYFENEFTKFLELDNLLDMIDKMKIENKKKDKELLANTIAAELTAKFNGVLKESENKIRQIMDHFFEDLDAKIHFKTSTINIKKDHIQIHFKKLFFSSLAGVATYGGLSSYMASLGNLGGYILITKTVSLLSSVGVSVGGTATAVSAVSAIGGPVTIAIGLAIITGLVAYTVSGVGWKKGLAKGIKKQVDKQETLKHYLLALDEYWTETIKGFEIGGDGLIVKIENEIDEEKRLLNLNPDELRLTISNLQNLKSEIASMMSDYELKLDLKE